MTPVSLVVHRHVLLFPHHRPGCLVSILFKIDDKKLTQNLLNC